MVYATSVKGKTITLRVSGYLWNRSLVMMDTQTESLWSHLLGEAMKGKYKGTKLEMIPSDMVTWTAWKKAHPKTTVLNLGRTSRGYTKEFYRSPQRFVAGWRAGGRTYHASFVILNRRPLLNLDLERGKLVLTFDPESTSARLFSRVVDGRVLDFEAAEKGRLRDKQTGTLWDRATGAGLEGKLAGKQLAHRAVIVSFLRKWVYFHPESRAVTR